MEEEWKKNGRRMEGEWKKKINMRMEEREMKIKNEHCFGKLIKYETQLEEGRIRGFIFNILY